MDFQKILKFLSSSGTQYLWRLYILAKYIEKCDFTVFAGRGMQSHVPAHTYFKLVLQTLYCMREDCLHNNLINNENFNI